MKMINTNNKWLFAITLLVAIVFTGCEKGDSDSDIGIPVIYIPQATITGLDNSYPVPNGPLGQNTSYNCFYKDGVLNIALGVVRAGYISNAKGFSVTLATSDEETTQKVAQLVADGEPATAIPSGIYQLPAKVEVAAGNNTGTCYIPVNLRELANSKATLEENNKWKKLVLGVKITNPTYYELSETNTSVVVIIDLNSAEWDNVDASAAESEVRTLFPKLS
jgi:hypothetical protein